jgi:hypothetical protein
MRFARMSNLVPVPALALSVLISSCGGGGGGGGNGPPPPPANQLPVANAGPDQSVVGCTNVTLAGAGTDPDGSVIGFTWIQTAGPQVTLNSSATANPSFTAPAVPAGTVFTFSLVVQDNGGASSASPDTVSVTVNAFAANVTVNGTIRHARVPFNAALNTGLNYLGTFFEPSPVINVQARGAGTTCVLATGQTAANGTYSLQVPGNMQVEIRPLARLQSAGPPASWDIAVRNWNADEQTPQPEPYGFSGQPFNSSTPNGSQNVDIPSGWNNLTRQPSGVRASAPFAILHTIHRALTFLTAPGLTPAITVFPTLNIHWAEDVEIGNTFYANVGGGSPNGRYISLAGQVNADIDEFDAHTIAHEFGHYIEDRFSRSDSVGGPHTAGDVLDPRVAFGEGFGYAFAAMVLGDPHVRDALGNLQSNELQFNVETDDEVGREGWYSEASNQEILWDLFDPVGEGGDDDVSLGFGPLWSVLANQQRTTPALTTVFPFTTAVKLQTTQDTEINELLVGEDIVGNADAFAGNELNDADRTGILPLYKEIDRSGVPVDVISTDDFGDEGNKLGSRQFLVFAPTSSGTATLNVRGATTTIDIDVLVFSEGSIIAQGVSPTNPETASFPFVSGQRYVIEVYDCANAGCNDTTPAGETTITVELD